MDIRLDALSHVFDPDIEALKDVDLAITGGQSVAIVGPNGSGKTTLLRHLDGLLRPTSGRVVIDGADAASMTVAQLAARVGLAFQEPDRQIFGRTVRSEVEFGPRHLGHNDKDRARAVDAALDATGLASAADRNPYDLGLAGRKLLSIASVLAMETPILALDEPTTGLDALARTRIGSIIDGVRRSDRTVIGASHDMRFVAEHFERIVVMRAGRVVLDGPVDEVFAEDNWPILEEADLEPTAASRIGASLGLGCTPTEQTLVKALRTKSVGGGATLEEDA